jgi:hypothetical protein
MNVNCPFCDERSNPIKGFFSLCKHIIACFGTDEVTDYYFKQNQQYICNILSIILIKEGLPTKALQDYLNNALSDDVKGITLSGSISSEDLDNDEEQIETEEIILKYNYDIFYAINIDGLINDFLNYVIDLNFKQRVIDLRKEYLLYNLIFNDDKIDLHRKIRPIFTFHGELNLDFNRPPSKLLRDCLKEYVNRDLYFKDNALLILKKDLESDNDARSKASDILWEFLYEEDNDYDNTKWVLRYLRENYSNIEDFINLFREIEFREILYELRNDLGSYHQTKEYRDDIINAFDKLKSKKFLKRFFNFFNRPACGYAEHFERSGIIRDFRAFIEEAIDILLNDNNIKIDYGMTRNKKLDKLVEKDIVNDFLKNKILFLWKQLNIISHTPEITDEHIAELMTFKKMFSEEVLPMLMKVFKRQLES